MQLSMLTSLLSQHAGAKPNPAMTTASSSQTSSPTMTAAAASGTGSSGSGAAGSASAAGNTGITANDFLSLLVTEMKNQDPTNQTDPMSYITQLVGVNSLEQLVQINQDLTPTTPTAPTTTTPPATGGLASSPMAVTGTSTTLPTTAASSTTAFLPLGSQNQVAGSAAQAISQAMGRSVPMASQASAAQLPHSHLAMQPEELRAIQMSIPGATMTGLSSTPIANVPTPSTGASGGSLP